MADVESTLARHVDMVGKLANLIDADFPEGKRVDLPGEFVQRIHVQAELAFEAHRALAVRLNRLMMLDGGVAGEIIEP